MLLPLGAEKLHERLNPPVVVQKIDITTLCYDYYRLVEQKTFPPKDWWEKNCRVLH